MADTTTHIISIVSGKGGSGKSLLTAVLGRALARENQRVLLVDFDIFVRGLTVLLTDSGRRNLPREGNTVSSFFADEFVPDSALAIQRFFECDLLPAVNNISAPFLANSDAIPPGDIAERCLRHILDEVVGKYDFVLFDNRAGLDGIVSSACRRANAVISVTEDDEVALQTNTNLVNYLKYELRISSIYSIINKGRRIASYNDLKNTKERRTDLSFLGVIPFDTDVLDDFGTDRFWNTIFQTLYFRSILDIWNDLAKREGYVELKTSRYSFPPKIFMDPRSGRLTLADRMLSMYGLLAVVSGVGFFMYKAVSSGGGILLSDSLPLMLTAVGAALMFMSRLGIRRLVLGDRTIGIDAGRQN